MHTVAALSTLPVLGQVTNTLFPANTPTRTSSMCSGKQHLHYALGFTSFLPNTHMLTGFGRGALMAFTFHVDVNGGSLLAGLLQADVAAHVSGMSLGNVQRRLPIYLFLPPHFGTLFSLPLHRFLALTLQLQGRVERDNNVGAGGGDGRLGVAWKNKGLVHQSCLKAKASV